MFTNKIVHFLNWIFLPNTFDNFLNLYLEACNLLAVSCHFHLDLCPLVHTDAEVQPHVDDGDHEEEEESKNKYQRFVQHRSTRMRIV